MSRAVATVAALAAGTVLLWLVAFPADWSAVPTADPVTYASPVTVGHWVVAAVGLAVLGFAGGVTSGPGAALLGVAVPAVALFSYRSATAEAIGANIWPVGALFAATPIAIGVAVLAVLGRAVRRRRSRA